MISKLFLSKVQRRIQAESWASDQVSMIEKLIQNMIYSIILNKIQSMIQNHQIGINQIIKALLTFELCLLLDGASTKCNHDNINSAWYWMDESETLKPKFLAIIRRSKTKYILSFCHVLSFFPKFYGCIG